MLRVSKVAFSGVLLCNIHIVQHRLKSPNTHLGRVQLPRSRTAPVQTRHRESTKTDVSTETKISLVTFPIIAFCSQSHRRFPAETQIGV